MNRIHQSAGIPGQWSGLRTIIAAASMLVVLVWDLEAAAKGGGGSTTDQWINVQFWLDDVHPMAANSNRLVGDGDSYSTDPTLRGTAVQPPYKHGVEQVSAQIGPDQNINLTLNSQYKKPAIRHFILDGGFPGGLTTACPPDPNVVIQIQDFPVLGTVIPDGFIQIYGQNHDDSGPGFERHVNARLVFKDNAGRTWTVHYGARPSNVFGLPSGFQYAPCGSCFVVERLFNTPLGKSRWSFWTEGQGADNLHLGYLYLLASDPKAAPMFAGVVNLPMSGTIESLSLEPEPIGVGYTSADTECPLVP